MTSENNVVPLAKAPPVQAVPDAAENQKQQHAVAARLTPRLAHSFCTIPSILLHGAQRLRPHEGARGLNSTEVLTLIHILDRKWDQRMPFPAITTIADQMGLKPRAVRAAIGRLEGLGFLKRVPMPNGGPNRYDLSGLFAALEKLLDEDAAAKDDAAEAAKAVAS